MGELFMSGEQKASMAESRKATQEARTRQTRETERLSAQEAKRAERTKRQRMGRRSLMTGAGNPETRVLG